MGLRVKMLEAKMNHVVPAVDQLKSGMELTEEYWKGLSHGLRESHKMVAVDHGLIASQPRGPRGKALPALSKTPEPMARRDDRRPLTPSGRGQERMRVSSRYQVSSSAR